MARCQIGLSLPWATVVEDVFRLVSLFAEQCGQRAGQLVVHEEAHGSGGVFDTGLDVLRHQKRKVRQNLRLGHAGGEQVQQVLHPQPVMADARASAALLRVKRDPVQMAHGGKVAGWRWVAKFGFVPVCSVEIGVETLLPSLSLPDDNTHSPNEKFDLDCLHAGMRMSARLWPELAKV